MTTAPHLREPWVDALRALALLGVFIVNLVGYAQAPDYPFPVGGPVPVDAPWAQAIHGLLLALVQGKAWPLLCFLFGYSLCTLGLRARAQGHPVRALLRTRYRKLLCIGIAHGSLVYFGDILTAYAVCGLVAAGWSTVRPARLLRIWRNLTLLVLALLLGFGALLWMGNDVASTAASTDGPIAANGLRAFLALNASTYLEFQISAAFLFFPILLWLTVAGILARRLRLLGQRRYARRFWTRHLGHRQLWLALLLNLALGLTSALLHRAGHAIPIALTVLYILGMLPGMWLVASLLGWAMRTQHRQPHHPPHWVCWLAPAGQHTLGMYLLLSMGIALGRVALRGLAGDTATTLALAVVAWLTVAIAARWASRLGMRNPLARWLSRTHTQPAALTVQSPSRFPSSNKV